MKKSTQKPKVFDWKCPKCGRQIVEVSEGRFAWNKNSHLMSHAMKIEKEWLRNKEVRDNPKESLGKKQEKVTKNGHNTAVGKYEV